MSRHVNWDVELHWSWIMSSQACVCSSGPRAWYPIDPQRCRHKFSWVLETKIHSSKYINAKTYSAMSSQRNDVTLWGSFKFSITHVVRNALCFNNVLNGGWTSTWSSLPVVIGLTSWSGFAVCLVSGSAKQFSLAIWLKSSRCPVLLSCVWFVLWSPSY